MTTYYELKHQHPKHNEVFFAFSNEQFEQGKAKIPEDKEIFRGYVGGMYGTKEGLHYYRDFYNNLTEQIKAECDPDDIYRYEFSNYECGYSGDDSRAVNITREYFPDWLPSKTLRDECQNAFNECN